MRDGARGDHGGEGRARGAASTSGAASRRAGAATRMPDDGSIASVGRASAAESASTCSAADAKRLRRTVAGPGEPGIDGGPQLGVSLGGALQNGSCRAAQESSRTSPR